INVSHPGKVDEESRRLVKTHVMQDFLCSKSVGCFKDVEVKPLKGLCLIEGTPWPVGNSPQAPPSFFLTFPIQTEPYMLKLVHDCA
ncbi:hypothetical protein DM02DRAFT_526291, partial [Periconia macrospinosa]